MVEPSKGGCEPVVPGSCKFPRAERLTKSREYEYVLKQGERLVGRGFVCYVVRQDAQGCKLGLIVSRKVGKAVVRNRVKRYVREFYRTHRQGWAAGARVVVAARMYSARMSYAECAEAMEQLLRRGGVLHG